MITLMIAIFVIGYIMIAFERPLRINKASTALFIGTILWIIYLYIAPEVIPQVSAINLLTSFTLIPKYNRNRICNRHAIS